MRKKMYEYLIMLSVAAFGVYLYFSMKDAEKSILEKGDFSIGTVTKIDNPLAPIRGNSHGYYYSFVDSLGKTWHKKASSNIIDGIFVGDKFLVVYSEEGSELLIHYGISDSIDYEAKKSEFINKVRKK